MPDKGTNDKTTKRKTSLSPEQRSRRIQQILFGMLAVIMIVSMVASLIAK